MIKETLALNITAEKTEAAPNYTRYMIIQDIQPKTEMLHRQGTLKRNEQSWDIDTPVFSHCAISTPIGRNNTSTLSHSGIYYVVQALVICSY